MPRIFLSEVAGMLMRRRRCPVAVSLFAVATLALASCSPGSSATDLARGDGSPAAAPVKIAMILKEFSNPYFISMENSAKDDAAKLGIDLTVSAGTSDIDAVSQITAIYDAIAAGDNGIIITPNGDTVNPALEKARAAGLSTIALDTVPTPPGVVSLTYATDNTAAGRLDGKWAAASLRGGPAVVALLDLEDTQAPSVDVDRDHGFLEGMGIPVGNPDVDGKEPLSGHYAGGLGGSYQIACQTGTQGTIPGGKSAMQGCMKNNHAINVVYAINEPAAQGATEALAAARNKSVLVTIDGGCSNLPYVASGKISATAGQFPGTMAADGLEAIYNLVVKHVHLDTPGSGFVSTGTRLYTNDPQSGVPSIDVIAAKKVCWG